jgi:vanillate/3-O-methylgallate O-demethylase
VIENATKEGMRDIGFIHFKKMQINNREVIVLRQNMAGELGYGVQGPREYVREIHDAIFEAMKPFLLNEKIIKGRAMQYGRNGYE